ncbi:MAG: 50S ribosomal protein L22 [Alphaproteobacteria bacterium]|nr:50S ribosomal protein L22 [Alphaproteobacteria bacterium]
MSKEANQPKQAKNEARAYAKFLRTSPRKLNLVAGIIRGKSAEKAMIDLDFCNRRIAKDVKKVLKSALTNAENNHNLDVDRLVVAEASVGKTMTMKRFHARGRGKASRVEKPFSRLTIVVREQAAAEKKAKAEKPAAKAEKKPAAKKAAAPKKKEA